LIGHGGGPREEPQIPLTREELARKYLVEALNLSPETTTEVHMIGPWSPLNIFERGFDLTPLQYNYMGPGTHTATRILNGVQPVNQTDLAALVHDVNYALANGRDQLLNKADGIANAMASGEGSWVMKGGLAARRALGLYSGDIDLNEANLGTAMREYLLASPAYSQYNLQRSHFVM